jgi:hypothetical protein
VRWTAIWLVLFVVFSLVVSAAATAAPVNINLSGRNGVVRQTAPGLDCLDGDGSYRHYLAEAPLAGGVVSKLKGMARTTLDVHHDPTAVIRQGPRAFLLGNESHTTVSNQRGTITFVLRSGTCDAPTLNFDGVTAGGSGTWGGTDIAGTGSYRQVTGSGSFTFSAEMNPGADNAWSLQLGGVINVLQPALTAQFVDSYWGHLGTDYLASVVTVVYRVANTGPGDAFDAMFLGGASPHPYVRPCGPGYSLLNPCTTNPQTPKPLGDLASCTLNADGTIPNTCDTESVTVRYRLDPLFGPCVLHLLGCEFPTTVTVRMSDALDVAGDKVASVTAETPPVLPPL